MHILALTTALVFKGWASWYSKESSGPITASGVQMSDSKPICAMRDHRLLWHWARVVNTSNGRSAMCRILDSGPWNYIWSKRKHRMVLDTSRVIDVSPLIAAKLGFTGLAPVKVYVRR